MLGNKLEGMYPGSYAACSGAITVSKESPSGIEGVLRNCLHISTYGGITAVSQNSQE
jgi:hypothetical protein